MSYVEKPWIESDASWKSLHRVLTVLER
jgi:hypothetical protein